MSESISQFYKRMQDCGFLPDGIYSKEKPYINIFPGSVILETFNSVIGIFIKSRWLSVRESYIMQISGYA